LSQILSCKPESILKILAVNRQFNRGEKISLVLFDDTMVYANQIKQKEEFSMKMPTKQTNTKRNLLAVGAVAAAVGLTPAATTLAHSGYDGNDRKDSTERNLSGQIQSSYHRNWHSQGWWHIPSTEDFTQQHESRLALYDKVINEYDLTVENGETLRATLETDAAEVSTALTAYAELKAELEDVDTPTDEQKAQLKQLTLDAISALYDYKESSKAYVSAIIDALKAEWNSEERIESFERQL
jgi:uncharacterized membrane protein